METTVKKKIKVKFKLIIPAEKEFEIIDEKMWLEMKNDFVRTPNISEFLANFCKVLNFRNLDKIWQKFSPSQGSSGM